MKKSEAILEYLVGNNASYLLLITKDSVKVEKIALRQDTLINQIYKLREVLGNYQSILAHKKASDKQYAHTAHWFYDKLIRPVQQELTNISHLIIIPDKQLGHIPFEVFLTKEPNLSLGYAQLPYLIKDYTLSYHYSTRIWLMSLAAKPKKNNGKLLAIAANYKHTLDDSILINRLPIYQRMRNALSELPAARKEVEYLSSKLNGLAWFDTLANERSFKSVASQFSKIHLAMHGELNAQNPMLSGLVFSENGDSIENNFLQAYEIAQLELSADLVVLSACQTGYGKFEQGNGVASLARAFLYAGVPSLVVSLWQIQDDATQVLMEKFYQNISSGMNKANAIRQAKLNYLETASGIKAHPAFWSSFILLGNSKPLAKQGINYWYFLLLVIPLLILALMLRHYFQKK